MAERTVRLVTVVGDPGVGKSRFVGELAALLDDRPQLVTWRQGRCLPYGDGITFWALGEIVKAHAGILESDDPAQVAGKLRAIRTRSGMRLFALADVERRQRDLHLLHVRGELDHVVGIEGAAHGIPLALDDDRDDTDDGDAERARRCHQAIVQLIHPLRF